MLAVFLPFSESCATTCDPTITAKEDFLTFLRILLLYCSSQLFWHCPVKIKLSLTSEIIVFLYEFSFRQTFFPFSSFCLLTVHHFAINYLLKVYLNFDFLKVIFSSFGLWKSLGFASDFPACCWRKDEIVIRFVGPAQLAWKRWIVLCSHFLLIRSISLRMEKGAKFSPSTYSASKSNIFRLPDFHTISVSFVTNPKHTRLALQTSNSHHHAWFFFFYFFLLFFYTNLYGTSTNCIFHRIIRKY